MKTISSLILALILLPSPVFGKGRLKCYFERLARSLTWHIPSVAESRTPDVFRSVEGARSDPAEKEAIARYVNEIMDETEVQKVLEYLRDPHPQKIALKDSLRMKDVKIAQNFPNALEALRIWDEKHGTNHAVNVGLELLTNLKGPLKEGRAPFHPYFLGRLEHAVSNSRDPRALERFVTAIADNPEVRNYYVKQGNMDIQLGFLLGYAVNSKQVAPKPALVAGMFADYIDNLLQDAPGGDWGNTPLRNRQNYARQAARKAHDYFEEYLQAHPQDPEKSTYQRQIARFEALRRQLASP